ncbi:DNA polymerase alpha subunit 1 [Carabus blaptoides fortunei]
MDNNDGSSQPRTKRQKTSHKSAAFERLKQLKGKGSKNKYEMSDVDNVYEVLDEKEYSKKVWERQDDDWIVDDDGSGYVEDGREIFDDDMDTESLAQTSKNNESRKKKKNLSKSAGKGNIQAMLSNMPEKKKEVVNLDHDDILSDVLSGMDDNMSSKTVNKSEEVFIPSDEQTAKNYLRSFSAPKPMKVKIKTGIVRTETTKKTQVQKKVVEDIVQPEEFNSSNTIAECDITENVNATGQSNHVHEVDNNDLQDISFDDDFDMDNIKEIPEQIEKSKSKEQNHITEENLVSGWETMQEGVENVTEETETVDISELPLVNNSSGDKVFRFYWWDAAEHFRQPGVVFLFGKTYFESSKSYVSCCVIVRNIERKIFLLPRPFQLNDDGTESDTPVKITDVYHEFNDKFADELDIKHFKSRKVTKKYAFDPDVPTQSDYLEIRYPANKRALESHVHGKTFSHVFGSETSYLELLLLDKKIKGPCWLEIKNPKSIKNPVSWCKLDINCENMTDVNIAADHQKKSPPPLVVATLNIREAVNKNHEVEIVMIGCLIHNEYHIDKSAPKPQFQQHFCAFTRPSHVTLPLSTHEAIQNYKGTSVQKCDSEKALLNYFLTRFTAIDPDLVVGHDFLDFHFSMLCLRAEKTNVTQWSRFGKLRRNLIPMKQSLQKYLMIGRLVCDVKVSARELIKSRSYDLDTLCETVLKLKDNERPDLESEDISKLFATSGLLLKLISLTMQDAAYITMMMYELNIMPLALQITSIAGNVMSQTLHGGRAQRNEFLLLHAFMEKDYIAPDKVYTFNKSKKAVKDIDEGAAATTTGSSRKKPTYLGGLVLDPKIGFYDKLILLMDFNSLYPSIIQEYNICFTTMSCNLDTDDMISNVSSEPGILPTEIRKLVESRRAVKKLMASADIPNDLRMQYNIRQLALKLTANSMYGCLGFAHSRFFAKHLASLITLKGRDILLHTRDLVQSMGFEVVYGDTDSIMINTNSDDFDQVFKIGNNIKQAVNKSFKQVELEVDGVFKYMLLLKKKKYAAVTMSKNKKGEIILEQEFKGLDIVRRDWSMLASEVGKMVLNHILSEQKTDERIENIITILGKIATDLHTDQVPVQLLVITKHLTKDPTMYPDKTALSHVLVALRYNQTVAKPLGAGDAVPYIICDDGTNNSATQRAYHAEEFKHSTTLKIDKKYYLAQQVHPVVSRLCEPIEGLDAYNIANALGIEANSFKKSKPAESGNNTVAVTQVNKFSEVIPFEFVCLACKEATVVKSVIEESQLWLEKCSNNSCSWKPIEHLNSIKNQLVLRIRNDVDKYYDKVMMCEDPLCTYETNVVTSMFKRFQLCNHCKNGGMYKKYSERELYVQISFYKHICDLSKVDKKLYDLNVANGYSKLRETIDYYLNRSGYATVNLTTIFDLVDLSSNETVKDDCIDQFDFEENLDDI